MQHVLLRFYEELNDYLPERWRKLTFACRFEGRVTIGALLGAIGVPLPEVDLVLCNGEAAGFSRVLADGDRVSIYPVFESLDIKEVTGVREEPLRRPAFLAAPGLHRLAACLRLLGFDARSGENAGPDELAARANAEERILLLRAGDSVGSAARIFRVSGAMPQHQATEVIKRLDLGRLIRPVGRISRSPRLRAFLESISWPYDF